MNMCAIQMLGMIGVSGGLLVAIACSFIELEAGSCSWWRNVGLGCSIFVFSFFY
jgi:hypothetical protein